MKNSIKHLLCLSLCAAALQTAASAQTLLLEYTFDDYTAGSTTAKNTGSLGSAADLTLYQAVGLTGGAADRFGTAADLYSAANTGLRNTGRAFNNTAATGMGSGGNTNTGNRAQTGNEASAAIGALQSFTVQGWFKTGGDTAIGDGAKLFEMYTTTGPKGLTVSAANGSQLILNVDGATRTSTGTAPYGATGSWVFFAVSYDGTLTANNVNFYVGSETGPTTLVSTGTLDAGALSVTGTGLALGNSLGSNSRPFDGLIDDIRLFGSVSDDSGVLSIGQIESLRATGAIPEPSTVALIAGASILGAALVVRRRRSIRM
ncbi:PEP-CTERM putative exosortase interaction domain-containing protein [Opitutaceae bacterium TAV1]|nr:PEP-CTERM putative exosortase interaction domain-containing protein [Opitutaceae bacterium TAV1]